MNTRLSRFLDATDSGSLFDTTLRGLTLHLLRGLAPHEFAPHATTFEAALTACATVDFESPRLLEPDEAQAAFDAWYLHHLERKPFAAPRAARVRHLLLSLAANGDPLYAWLLGHLAAKCGVDARRTFSDAELEPTPLHHGYRLTHEVLLDTDYFARPASHPLTATWADDLAAVLPQLEREPNFDLTGEVAMCLSFLRHPAARSAKALIANAPMDGSPHEQASLLLGLAGP